MRPTGQAGTPFGASAQRGSGVRGEEQTNMKGMQLGVGVVGWGIAALGLVACGSAPPPHERQASSAAAIRTATEMDAQQVPQAALHLKLAQEEFDKGKALMNDGENERAAYMLMRSQ